jgi:hypothetical protein
MMERSQGGDINNIISCSILFELLLFLYFCLYERTKNRQLKGKITVVLIEHHELKTYGVMEFHTLSLLSFTPRPLYPQGKDPGTHSL